MRRRVTTIAVVAFLLAALAGPIALVFRSDRGQAAFGDNELLGVNRLSSATVDVELGSRTVQVESDNLAPGDRSVGSIEVVNVGSLPVRYAVVSDASADPLGQWLTWELWEKQAGRNCDSSPAPVDPLIAGLVLGSAGLTSQSILGDVAVGLDPGDRILQPGSNDILCVAVTFELTAPDSVQDRRLDQGFTIVAEQHTDELVR